MITINVSYEDASTLRAAIRAGLDTSGIMAHVLTLAGLEDSLVPEMNVSQMWGLWRKFRDNPDGSPDFMSFMERAQIGSWDCLMIQWCGMWLGIEQDGYTHS